QDVELGIVGTRQSIRARHRTRLRDGDSVGIDHERAVEIVAARRRDTDRIESESTDLESGKTSEFQRTRRQQYRPAGTVDVKRKVERCESVGTNDRTKRHVVRRG